VKRRLKRGCGGSKEKKDAGRKEKERGALGAGTFKKELRVGCQKGKDHPDEDVAREGSNEKGKKKKNLTEL